MSPFTIPNEAAAAFADQAEVDAVDIEILVAGYSGTGVVSGCEVTAQATPDMTVAVAAGTIVVGGAKAAVAAGNLVIGAADATNARFDLIVVNNAGVKAVVAGAAGTNPTFPAVPASSVVLAAVYVPAADAAINANQIVDKRVPVATASSVLVDPTVNGANDVQEALAAQAAKAGGKEVAYAQVTASQTGIGTARTDLTGLSATFTADGSKRYEVVVSVYVLQRTGASLYTQIDLYEGTTRLQAGTLPMYAANAEGRVHFSYRFIPSAGAHTLKLTGVTQANTFDVLATASLPSFIQVIELES